ncbi:MAG TPA: chemotaxis-specific protein-glutamate methyltransferase CheB [Gemmatimonadales bacterium]
MSPHSPHAVQGRLRVLVVEDSPTVRQLLVAMLESDPGIEVVGQAVDGREAVREAIRLRPDLITMDINMPELDGLEATREIMSEAPTPIIVVSSTVSKESVALSLDATQAGALMVLPKPRGPQAGGDFEAEREELVRMAKAMAQVKVVRRWSPRRGRLRPLLGPRPIVHSGATAGDTTLRLVAIGCSTGGPAALRRIIDRMSPDFPAPIAVVQHMARGFVGGLATWLDGGGPMRVKVVTDGEALLPGTMYIAADDRQLGIERDRGDPRVPRARLGDLPPVGGFRPSVSYLFGTAARSFGASAAGVILTGMGSDGVEGARELHGAGAVVLAQDAETSVVYGMAQEAVRVGAVDEVLPLDSIAPRLRELAR